MCQYKKINCLIYIYKVTTVLTLSTLTIFNCHVIEGSGVTCRGISISSSLKVIDVRTGALRRDASASGLNCLPRKSRNYYTTLKSVASVHGRSYTVYGAAIIAM